ncbi:MAG: hypothetical protein ACREUC_08655 [Steroidobacteraceae bacterium]
MSLAKPIVSCAAIVALCLGVEYAHAQQKPATAKSDDLDVTMQIIVDSDAKLPDEVIRRIPLPARKPAERPPAQATTPEAATKGQERAQEAQELGREMAEQGKERALDASEQREQARRSAAQERRRNPGPPPEPPRRPEEPPRR